jgi:hypothetical protein
MRETALPSPNIGGRGHHLRRVAAQAISQIEVIAPNYPGGLHPQATDLRNFFIACANSLIDETPGADTVVT